MDIYKFYQDWLNAQFDSGVAGDDFSFVRNKFDKVPSWSFFKRHINFKTKAQIKSAAALPKKIFNYSISIGEKRFSTKYVSYICEKKPILDESLFPKENLEEIKSFLTKQFYCAHFDYVSWKHMFPGHEYKDLLIANKKNTSFMKKKKGYYQMGGFKARNYSFEYGVLVNKCALDTIPQSALANIPNGIAIDCGASNGDSTYFLASLGPKKTIALEPDPVNFGLLEEGIALNHMDNVIPVNLGAGSAAKKMKFLNDDFGGKITEIGNSEIQTDRIDAIVHATLPGEKVGIIKMDIEGYEQDALKGAENTIKKDKPVLIIAVYHSGEQFFEIPPYLKSLNPHYKFKIVHTNPLGPTYEEYLLAY